MRESTLVSLHAGSWDRFTHCGPHVLVIKYLITAIMPIQLRKWGFLTVGWIIIGEERDRQCTLVSGEPVQKTKRAWMDEKPLCGWQMKSTETSPIIPFAHDICFRFMRTSVCCSRFCSYLSVVCRAMLCRSFSSLTFVCRHLRSSVSFLTACSAFQRLSLSWSRSSTIV